MYACIQSGVQYMVGVPGFWPGCLVLDRRTGWGLGAGGEGGKEKYSFTVLLGWRNTVLQ